MVEDRADQVVLVGALTSRAGQGRAGQDDPLPIVMLLPYKAGQQNVEETQSYLENLKIQIQSSGV